MTRKHIITYSRPIRHVLSSYHYAQYISHPHTFATNRSLQSSSPFIQSVVAGVKIRLRITKGRLYSSSREDSMSGKQEIAPPETQARWAFKNTFVIIPASPRELLDDACEGCGLQAEKLYRMPLTQLAGWQKGHPDCKNVSSAWFPKAVLWRPSKYQA